MKSILNLLSIETIVIHNRQPLKVSSLDVIVRDIIKISIRNKVPTNMRLLSTSRDVRFNCLMLTGKSNKVKGAINITNINFVKSQNVALIGIMVTNGSVTSIVILTRGSVVIGRIAKAISAVKDEPTLI